MSLLGWLRRSSRNPKSTKECSLIFEITTDRQGVKNMLLDPGTSAKAMILMMEGLLSDAGVCISRYKASEEVYLVTQEERTPYHYALCGVLRIHWNESTNQVMDMVEKIRSIIREQSRRTGLTPEMLSVRAEVRDLV